MSLQINLNACLMFLVAASAGTMLHCHTPFGESLFGRAYQPLDKYKNLQYILRES